MPRGGVSGVSATLAGNYEQTARQTAPRLFPGRPSLGQAVRRVVADLLDRSRIQSEADVQRLQVELVEARGNAVSTYSLLQVETARADGLLRDQQKALAQAQELEARVEQQRLAIVDKEEELERRKHWEKMYHAMRLAHPSQAACDECSAGVMDITNPHWLGNCSCKCHGPSQAAEPERLRGELRAVHDGVAHWRWRAETAEARLAGALAFLLVKERGSALACLRGQMDGCTLPDGTVLEVPPAPADPRAEGPGAVTERL